MTYTKPIEIDGDKVKEIINHICDQFAAKKYDKLHAAVAMKCILRTFAKDGLEVEIEDAENESMQ